jgi:hypothetical protein
MTAEIGKLFPHCPPRETAAIAAHTATRNSGRVDEPQRGGIWTRARLRPRQMRLSVINARSMMRCSRPAWIAFSPGSRSSIGCRRFWRTGENRRTQPFVRFTPLAHFPRARSRKDGSVLGPVPLTILSKPGIKPDFRLCFRRISAIRACHWESRPALW